MVSKLHVVIWGRRCCARETKGRRRKAREDHVAGRARVIFQDARLVEHNSTKLHTIEPMQPVVVGDVQTGLNVRPVATEMHRQAELPSFPLELLRDRERRHDQDRQPRVVDDDTRPFERHPPLAETAIRKDRRASPLQCPSGDVCLEREEQRR